MENCLLIHNDIINFMTIFIPFGINCAPASILRWGGLRAKAMPFDWIFASPNSIKDALDNKFENWFDQSKLTYGVRKEDGQEYTAHKDYPISDYEGLSRGFFNHHNMKDLDVISMYKNRIERFYDAIESNEKIIFLTSCTKEELIEHGLFNYFNRSAPIDFVFLNWKHDKKEMFKIKTTKPHIKINYTCEEVTGTEKISKDICSTLRNIYLN